MILIISESNTKFDDVPFIQISYTDESGKVKVTGHEGRHRALALKKLGYTKMPVVLASRDIRWSEQVPQKEGMFDWVEVWPEILIGEDGKTIIPFPVKREEATLPAVRE